MDWSLKRQFSSKACIPIRQLEARSKLNKIICLPRKERGIKSDQTPFKPSTTTLDLNSFLFSFSSQCDSKRAPAVAHPLVQSCQSSVLPDNWAPIMAVRDFNPAFRFPREEACRWRRIRLLPNFSSAITPRPRLASGANTAVGGFGRGLFNVEFNASAKGRLGRVGEGFAE